MRSAQRREKILNNKRNNSLLRIGLFVFFPLLIILAVFVYFKINTRFWNGSDKVSFVYPSARGDVQVIILDPQSSEETILTIPADTEVDVARNYGTIRIKNVWQLGINEKLGGNLLAQTVTEDFLFPTTLWSKTDLSNLWQFVFKPVATNIPIGDRLNLALFSLKIKNIDKTQIDLGKSQFLQKTTLIDGLSGYKLVGPVSDRLTAYFADNNFANQTLKFDLVDQTGKYGITDNVGQILEVMGGKVVGLDKRAVDVNLDCNVLGQNLEAVKKVAMLFGCQKISGSTNFDLEMRMGEKFAARF